MFQHTLVRDLYGPVGDGLSRFARRFGDAIPVCPTLVETVEVQEQTLLVSDRLPRRSDVHILLPQGAVKFKVIRAATPKTHVDHVVLLVPFGSGESGIQAMRLAMQVAEHFMMKLRYGTEILFYHTTWRKPGVESEDGLDHLVEDAREVEYELRLMAQSQHLTCHTQIDIAAPTVPDGIIGCALRHDASLIVMARGNEVRLGSYVAQMAELSPVPLLIARKEV